MGSSLPLQSVLLLFFVAIGGPYLAYMQHGALPEPLSDLVNPHAQKPQISEKRILELTKYLSEDIGYRTVGSYEHAASDLWLSRQTAEIKETCDKLVRSTGRALECEVWRQQGTGSHRFDMAGKRLYKTYVDISNHIIRISNGTEASKENAVLVNAHFDSTLPSPGAADDALSIAILLDIIRVLLSTDGWTPKHSIIFLFNGAEESLQDGSQLYSTQHPTRSTVRAVINLEAAGTENRELLFQATSEEMIEAYSHVPRPFGTIFANEVFSSGIILSDTDFRQFEQYLDVTGLDMAVVGHSYFYHTRKDLVENIEPGVAQNMGENTLALLKYLSTSTKSPLPSLARNTTTTTSHTVLGDPLTRLRPKTVFFSYLGLFWTYSFTTAKIIYGLLALASLSLVRTRLLPVLIRRVRNKKDAQVDTSKLEDSSPPRGIISVLVALLGSIILPNIVALGMVLADKQMSWFKDTVVGPVSLYGPAAAFGALLSQTIVPQASERELLAGILLLQSFGAFGVQMFDIGSAALLFLNVAPLYIVLFVTTQLSTPGKTAPIPLITYALAGALPLYTGTLVLLPTLEVFVPLTGRIGASLPSDFLIATIVSFMGSLGLPLFLPFVRRFNRGRILLLLGALTVAGIGAALVRVNFDPNHPRRMFVLALEDMDTNQYSLHLGSQDSAPGMDALAQAVSAQFAESNTLARPASFEEAEVGWNIVYPFSTVLKLYQMGLPSTAAKGYSSPWKKRFTVKAKKDTITPSGNRVLQLEVKHTGVIWTVLSFEAHVVKWSLDDHPPAEYSRHWIREASFHKVDTYKIDLEILPGPDGKHSPLKFDFVGLQEGGMWPAKKADYLRGGGKDATVSMRLFEKLDEFLDVESGGTVDATLLGTVKGSVNI